MEIFTLHKYYFWANRMRTHFDDIIANRAPDEEYSEKEDESNLYMSYWYGGLYVVIEGWRELALTDNKIDSLLTSPNIDLLRRYRNGVFHFQRDYFDERFIEFIRNGINCVEWIRNLNREFGRYFLEWYKTKGITSNRE
jgi:hypothetical protein